MRAGFKDAASGMAPLLLQGCRRSREMTTGIRVSSPHPTGTSEPKARTQDLLSLTDSHCPHQQPLSEGWQTLTKDAGWATSWGGPRSRGAPQAWKPQGAVRGHCRGLVPPWACLAPFRQHLPPYPQLSLGLHFFLWTVKAVRR